jgi:hypothetical protein
MRKIDALKVRKHCKIEVWMKQRKGKADKGKNESEIDTYIKLSSYNLMLLLDGTIGQECQYQQLMRFIQHPSMIKFVPSFP